MQSRFFPGRGTASSRRRWRRARAPAAARVAALVAAFVSTLALAQGPDWSAVPGSAPPTPPANALQRAADQRVPPATPAFVGTQTATKAGVRIAPAQGTLFDLPDATPISVGGRSTNAGELKRSIVTELTAKAGPRRTIQGPTRARVASLVAGTAPHEQQVRSHPLRTGPGFGTTATTGAAAFGLQNNQRIKERASDARTADVFCASKGPPSISEVDGTLTPGGKAQVYGTCFGDRAGHVEIIGSVPGGKLEVAFTGWSQTGIDLEVATNLAGAADGMVAVTVVGADGRRSPAASARFVATRNHVEIPTRLWTPDADFVLTATTNGGPSFPSGVVAVNPAAAGQIVRSLRINPQCALDSMSVDVLAGNVTDIRGFEQGPPNEATATILWTGTCIDTRTITTTDYVVTSSTSVSISTACRVALEPRAWAWCPAGLSP